MRQLFRHMLSYPKFVWICSKSSKPKYFRRKPVCMPVFFYYSLVQSIFYLHFLFFFSLRLIFCRKNKDFFIGNFIRAGHSFLNEILYLHLFKLSASEQEVPGCDLIPKCFSYLGYSARQLQSGILINTFE